MSNLENMSKSYYYDPAVFSVIQSSCSGNNATATTNNGAHFAGSFGASNTTSPKKGGAWGEEQQQAEHSHEHPQGDNSSFAEDITISDAAGRTRQFGGTIAPTDPGSPTDWANVDYTKETSERFCGAHPTSFSAVVGDGECFTPTQRINNTAGTASQNSGNKHMIDTSALSRCAIVTGNSHPQLAEDVAALLGKRLHPISVKTRSNGEIAIKILESVNDKDVFIVHSMCAREETHDINEGIMELMLLTRKLRQAYAATITAVIPNMAYGRADHKTDLRVPISSSAVAMMMMQMGVDRVVSLDLHSGQIQGAFNAVPVDSLSFLHEFAHYVMQRDWLDPPRTVIVSPDASGVERAKRLGDVIGATSVVTIVKRRLEGGKIDCMQAVGEVRGKICIIVDDIIDSGKTLIAAADLLREMGASRIVACVSHAIMTDPCSRKVAQCEALDELVVSDSIPQAHHKAVCGSKLVVLPTAPLLAMSILQGLRNSTAGSLFTGPTDKDQLLKLVHAQLL